MPRHIPDHPRLLIVSDTAMWETAEGVIAFEPVVREIENFGDLFSSITWIGYGYSGSRIIANARAVKGVKVKYVVLPRVGGETLSDKIKILWKAPAYFFKVWKHVRANQVIHSRGPSLPAFFAIILSLFDRSRIYWHKYAGNWETAEAPFFYRLQKKLLRIAGNSKVAVNGSWPGEPAHIINVENPCLTTAEITTAHLKAAGKTFTEPYTLCFVGNLNHNKGIIQLTEAISRLNGKYFSKFLIAGDGPEKKKIEELVKGMKIEVFMPGFQNREQLNDIYSKSHFIILPSASEGFPKVISEAMAYGCIPIVTDMSCISQHVIENKTGFLLEDNSLDTIIRKIQDIFSENKPFKEISDNALKMSDKFTYSEYNNNIRSKILS